MYDNTIEVSMHLMQRHPCIFVAMHNSLQLDSKMRIALQSEFKTDSTVVRHENKLNLPGHMAVQ